MFSNNEIRASIRLVSLIINECTRDVVVVDHNGRGLAVRGERNEVVMRVEVHREHWELVAEVRVRGQVVTFEREHCHPLQAQVPCTRNSKPASRAT